MSCNKTPVNTSIIQYIRDIFYHMTYIVSVNSNYNSHTNIRKLNHYAMWKKKLSNKTKFFANKSILTINHSPFMLRSQQEVSVDWECAFCGAWVGGQCTIAQILAPVCTRV